MNCTNANECIVRIADGRRSTFLVLAATHRRRRPGCFIISASAR